MKKQQRDVASFMFVPEAGLEGETWSSLCPAKAASFPHPPSKPAGSCGVWLLIRGGQDEVWGCFSLCV